jgi:calcineurin-like phosphoesterase family protein
MDSAYIKAWNETVGPDDRVRHLGDLCFGRLEMVQEIMGLLNGKISVIPGNHDKWVEYYRRKREQDSEFEILSASGYAVRVEMNQIQEDRIDGQLIVSCHYPMRSWNASYHGSWHAYGHVHKKIEPWGMSIDVGVDRSEGRPISFEEMAQYMVERAEFLKSIRSRGDDTTTTDSAEPASSG